MKLALGVDIGGTNTGFGLVDEKGNAIFESSVRTTDFAQPEKLAEAIYRQTMVFLSEKPGAELAGIGIGAPNGNYYNGTIEYAPNLKWTGIVNLIKVFSRWFSAPIFVTNDANAATIGEMRFGAAQGMTDFVMITLGTGVGSGFVSNGSLIYGKHGFGGEVGHMIISPDGRDCGCGRKGCLETYASATGVVRTAHIMLAKSGMKSILRDLATPDLTSESITRAAAQGDGLALEILDYTALRLGFSLANIATATDPEAFILFGGLANADDLLLHPTRRYMEESLLNIFKGKIQLLVSGLQDQNAAILGAGALVWEELNKRRFDEINVQN